MQDLITQLTQLNRPRLLIRAARNGSEGYHRNQHLARILGRDTLPRSAQAVLRLMEIEALLNTQRRSGDAGYSIVRHVDVLIALMGEARLLKAARPNC